MHLKNVINCFYLFEIGNSVSEKGSKRLLWLRAGSSLIYHRGNLGYLNVHCFRHPESSGGSEGSDTSSSDEDIDSLTSLDSDDDSTPEN